MARFHTNSCTFSIELWLVVGYAPDVALYRAQCYSTSARDSEISRGPGHAEAEAALYSIHKVVGNMALWFPLGTALRANMPP